MEAPYLPLTDYIQLKVRLDAEEAKTQRLKNVLVLLMNIENYEARSRLITDTLQQTE
jgi:hypothetical protein